ncbi:hypothetical protein [Actinocrispum wychmicini]|uniref:Nucleotidyltransferase-like protein n=1 Tax=Actinocrispum wychmicini TaxID=1213861 RepID=A0A4R2JU54_9PSEU|nr:hypothetical protein [Actinocrispum wychmicini]TCO60539.1 hypothetical protein EV192_103114 [Actinocrispum wychmicini]
MFTPNERENLRNELVTAAKDDPRIVAAALTGSAAVGQEDAWSDIDLALSLDPAADTGQVITDWTEHMRRHDVVAHLDMPLSGTLFRVFLLRSTLQVDIAL